MIVDGKKYGPYDAFIFPWLPIFSADGKQFVYAASRDENGKSFVVLNGQEYPKKYAPVHLSKEFFSPDGSRTIYKASRYERNEQGQQEFLVLLTFPY